jgi:hypothetical protein
MARSRRESDHRNGITDQKRLQRTSATKSANIGHIYSMTSLANPKIDAGMSTPSAFAVFKFTTNSNLLD